VTMAMHWLRNVSIRHPCLRTTSRTIHGCFGCHTPWMCGEGESLTHGPVTVPVYHDNSIVKRLRELLSDCVCADCAG
jgi:hypothetical protein